MKLSKIISEIKQGITPELIDKLDDELMSLSIKSRGEIIKNFGFNNYHYVFGNYIDWVTSLPQPTLNKLFHTYKEAIEKNKHERF
jgi:hypothetical protein